MSKASSRRSRREVFLLRGISVLLAFHLGAIIIGPSPLNYFYWWAAPIYRVYWQAFEFGNQWSFFAPEPGVPPVFLEWEMEDDQGRRTTGQSPEHPSPYWNRERQTMRMAMTGYLMLTEGAAERVMVPYLCKTHPDARSVSLWRRVHGVPALEGFAKGEEKLGVISPPVRQWVSHSFCEGERAAAKRSKP